MKIQYVLILFLLISCAKNTKEKNNSIDKTEEVIEIPIDSTKIVTSINFDSVISTIRIRPLPLIDATNFDSFIEAEDYHDVNVSVLQLENIYPNFHKEGFNYRAISNYKLELSENFISVVVTVKKGDHEMESRLVNYDFKGNILDSKVIAYDEIAEGVFKVESKIESHRITINYTEWTDEKHQSTEIYDVKVNGKLLLVTEEDLMIKMSLIN